MTYNHLSLRDVVLVMVMTTGGIVIGAETRSVVLMLAWLLVWDVIGSPCPSSSRRSVAAVSGTPRRSATPRADRGGPWDEPTTVIDLTAAPEIDP